MRNLKGLLGIFILCFMMLALPLSSAAVSTSFSQAIINWPLPSSGINITFLNQESFLSAASGNDTRPFPMVQDEIFSPGFGDATASAVVPGASSIAQTRDSQILGTVSIFANGVSPTVMTVANATASHRVAEFVANETGTLTIHANFFLSQDLTSQFEGDRATGLANAALVLFTNTPGTDQIEQDFQELRNTVAGRNTFNGTRTGTLSVTRHYVAGDTGGFLAGVESIAEASSSAPIPEPSTLLLLGSGLAGLALYKWRKAKAPNN